MNDAGISSIDLTICCLICFQLSVEIQNQSRVVLMFLNVLVHHAMRLGQAFKKIRCIKSCGNECLKLIPGRPQSTLMRLSPVCVHSASALANVSDSTILVARL